MVLDEAQFVKYALNKTHEACYSLHRRCTILLSGTILDNKWTDVHGLLRMLSGHPFQSFSAFISTFGNPDPRVKRPKRSKFRRLEKLLLACTIVRPDSLFDLANMTITDVNFELGEKELAASNAWAKKYENAIKMAKERKQVGDKTALMYIIKTMQQAIHPEIAQNQQDSDGHAVYGLLNSMVESDNDFDASEEDEEGEDIEVEEGEDIEMVDDNPTESREAWVRRVTESGTALGSERMTEFLQLFRTFQR